MQKSQRAALGVVLSFIVAAGAHAALPTEAAAAFASAQTNVTDILAVLWPIVASLTGGFLLIKLFKRGAGKI